MASRCLIGGVPDYAQEVRPILERRCFSCHSRLQQKGGLRLDAGSLILKGGKDGAVIQRGNSSASPMIRRLLSADDSERMPPEGKPLAAEHIEILRAWIDGGGVFPADEPVPSSPSDHWAFQAPRRPPIPGITASAGCRNPIDRFIDAALQKSAARPGKQAQPLQLLRRLHLDLTGLPPSLADQSAFEARIKVVSPDEALDEVVDGLLRRPQYGERWARHWLDLVRYADSNGYERDAAKPFVWRYRDWVIRAFNRDMPYNEFVNAQLAGDEMPDASGESLIATGMLRLGHWDDEPADPETDRFDQLDDIVSTTSQVFLGLTLGCARCHDHKFEPLAARDYYSMVAVFNPLKRPQNGRTELTLPVGSPEELAGLAKTSKGTNQATLIQGYFLNESTPKPGPTHILIRGSARRPGEEVSAAVPAVLVKQQPVFPSASDRTSRRRLGLAQWIASPENPLTARVIVNRVWQQHFGIGLVRTPSDFGLMGEPPTHPELLDWLADWFVHEGGWSIKRLHRIMLTSRTWRQARSAARDFDPDNRLMTHLPYRRLEAEAMRDSILSVSGQLNSVMYGPAMFPAIPEAALEANTDRQTIWKESPPEETSRRTVYTFIKRGLVVPMLEVLDLCDTVNSTARRQVTTVAPQALTLFNGDFVNQQARHLAARLVHEGGPGSPDRIRLAFRLALCRQPTETELASMMAFLGGETPVEPRQMHPVGHPPAGAASSSSLQQFCRVLFNLNEFAYPD